MVENWKKEAARDVIALGSWIFYVLVIVRALIQPYRPFTDHLVIAGVVLIFAGFVFKEIDHKVSRGLVLAVFVSLFYKNMLFAVFAGIIVVGLIVSANYLGSSRGKVFKGIAVGLIAIIAGYYVPGLY